MGRTNGTLMAIAQSWPPWRGRFVKGVSFSDLECMAHELCLAAHNRQTKDFGPVFSAIEACVREGTPEAREYLINGLLQTMQDDAAWHLDPPDVFDEWLGPMSAELWADLIGLDQRRDIRTLADRRRVMVNGYVVQVVWQAPGGDLWVWREGDGTAHRKKLEPTGPVEETWTEDRAEAFFQQFQPLVAEQIVRHQPDDRPLAAWGLDRPWAHVNVEILEPSGLLRTHDIALGARTEDGLHYAMTEDGRVFLWALSEIDWSGEPDDALARPLVLVPSDPVRM